MAKAFKQYSDGWPDKYMNEELIEVLAPKQELRTAYDQLKPFERQFVDAYLVNDSPMTAIRAVYGELNASTDERSKTALKVRAWDLVRRPLVQAAIAERMKAHGEKWSLTIDRVLEELAKIAYSNIDDYIDRSTGEIKFDFTEDSVTRDQMAAVGELTVETTVDKDGNTTTKTKFKLHDKLGALDKAMKHLGLFAPEQVEFRGMVKTINGTARTSTITTDMTDDEAADHYARFLQGE